MPILDLAITGAMMGAFYALMAVGLSLVFGIFRIVNFSHGEFYLVGAYVYCLLGLNLALPPWLALVTAVILGSFVGAGVERWLIRPMFHESRHSGRWREEYPIIVTFGLSLFLMNLANQLAGPFAFRGPVLWAAPRVTMAGISLSGHRLVSFVLAAVFLATMVWALKYTLWGKRVQAVAQNPVAAAIAGINPDRIGSTVMALSGGLAALAGGLLSPIFLAYPTVGVFPAVKSYIIVVLGGLRSVTVSLVGALESFAAAYLSYAHRDTFGFLLLLVFLLWRPYGLWGQRTREI
ncbi:MAG: branched-chain amino acid ABC transporter permease [Deltaproteobacteria bacterium]|nr:branched-chain amino acid ABC transporter permease [Deltaproteobacteria bacterium]